MKTETASDVLLVDDEIPSLQGLIAGLESHGHRVRTVDDSGRALESVEEEWPDIVLLDVHMPGIDGFEVCRRLKQSEQGQVTQIPVVFVSGSNCRATMREAFSAGGADYIHQTLLC